MGAEMLLMLMSVPCDTVVLVTLDGIEGGENPIKSTAGAAT